VTHRCHNRSFLFRFARDRQEYRERLRASLKSFRVDLLTYCITSNHTHLVIYAEATESLSGLMQKLEGEFAESYNLRKRRSGAFWSGRYHATMIEGGGHLWNCLKYVDLNMVRAGVVAHPREWEWCGYHELVGRRQRYRLVAREKLAELLGDCAGEALAVNYEQTIGEAVTAGELARNPIWTESIAVGGESFVSVIEAQTRNRVELTREEVSGRWVLRERATVPYG
jgi:putative transposase